MKAEPCFVLALWYSAGIQLSKDDEGITSIFIAEATLDRISSDGIGSLIGFSASSFRLPPYQQPVPLVEATELQLSCNFQPHFYSVSVLKLPSWIPRWYGGALSCMFVSSLSCKFWNLNYRRAPNSAVIRDVRCDLLFNKRVFFPLPLQTARMKLAVKIPWSSEVLKDNQKCRN